MALSVLEAYIGTTGLVDIGYRFITGAGAFSGARQTAGVWEAPGARGVYGVANPTIPADAVGVYWDSTGTASAYAYEWFDPRTPNATTGTSGALLLAGSNVGTFSISGDFLVGGITTLTGALTLSGSVALAQNLTITGNTTHTGTTTFTGAVAAINASNDIRLGATERTAIGTATNVVLSAAHGSGPWGYLPGPGPNAITITVTDGTNDLQSVSAGLYQANILIANGVTDASGNITFSLAAGTYQVVLVKGGYTFTPVSRTVTGPQAGTLVNDLVMTEISPPTPPVDPSLCTVFGYMKFPDGSDAANVEVKLSLTTPTGRRPTTTGGNVISFSTITAITDNAGYFEVDVIRTDELDQNGCAYVILCEQANFNVRTAVAAAVLDVSDL